MRFAGVLFDLDGVLVDSNSVVVEQMRVWARGRGVPFEGVERVMHGRPTVETVRLVAPHLDAEEEAATIEEMERAREHEVLAFMGAQRLLGAIDAARWAVVTSSTRASALRKLDFAGLPIPGVLVSADDVTRAKPAPEPYARAAERLGLAADRCAVVEDSPSGVAAGRAAGAYVIGLATTVPVDLLGDAHVVLGGLHELSVTGGGIGVTLTWAAPR
ncbi:MAG: HAD-IA family hydrolase [Chloroflexota bacterium]